MHISFVLFRVWCKRRLLIFPKSTALSSIYLKMNPMSIYITVCL